MNAQTQMEFLKLHEAMRRGLAPMPDVRAAMVKKRNTDADGSAQSYDIEVDGQTHYGIPARGTSYGEGQPVQVQRVGGAAIGDWQIAGPTASYGTELPTMVGGVTTFTTTTMPSGVGLHVTDDGMALVSGLIGEDGIPFGARAVLAGYGVLGYTANDELTFGLFTTDYQHTENDVVYNFHEGDALLGLLDKGHLALDSLDGTLSWMVGDYTLFSSEMVEGYAFNWMRGMLRIAEEYVGAGIEIGKQPGGANLLQLLNDYGVPLIVLRAGLTEDVNKAYARIGPPEPLPGVTVTSDADGVPVVQLDGGTLLAGTVIATALDVDQLSAITADMGIIRAGRTEWLQDGTNFISWADAGNAIGLVAGFNNVTGVGELWGLNAGVKQAYFGSDGKLYGSAGNVILDANGFSILEPDADTNTRAYRFLDDDGDTVRASISGYNTVGVNNIYVNAKAIAGEESVVALQGAAPTGKPASAVLTAYSGNGSQDFVLIYGCVDDGTESRARLWTRWNNTNPAIMDVVSDITSGRVEVSVPVALVDGITAPATLSGYAQIYVDTADGDLKVKFGDGTVKVLAADT